MLVKFSLMELRVFWVVVILLDWVPNCSSWLELLSAARTTCHSWTQNPMSHLYLKYFWHKWVCNFFFLQTVMTWILSVLYKLTFQELVSELVPMYWKLYNSFSWVMGGRKTSLGVCVCVCVCVCVHPCLQDGSSVYWSVTMWTVTASWSHHQWRSCPHTQAFPTMLNWNPSKLWAKIHLSSW